MYDLWLLLAETSLEVSIKTKPSNKLGFYDGLLIKHLNDLGFRYLGIFKTVAAICHADT